MTLSKVLEEYVVADPDNPTVSELTVVAICQRGELDDAADDREGMEVTNSCLEAIVRGHEATIDVIKDALKETVNLLDECAPFMIEHGSFHRHAEWIENTIKKAKEVLNNTQ
jgi:hypothetical protein